MPPFDTVIHFILILAAIGAIVMLLLFACRKVAEIAPDPFKIILKYLEVVIIVLCCVWAIYAIADLAGLGGGHAYIGHN